MTTATTKELHAKICPECGQMFHTDKPAKVFCDEPCRVSYANTSLSRGKPVTPLLVTWRRYRDSRDPAKKATANRALSEMCRIASMYIAEDRRLGRDSAIQLEALWNGHHVSKFDRPMKSRTPKLTKAQRAVHAPKQEEATCA